MNNRLRIETEKLVRSWTRHHPDMLRDYLVSGVEDPRLNLQSVLTRHFLARGVMEHPPARLMEQEVMFSAAMNRLLEVASRLNTQEDSEALLHALRAGADNFEGVPAPRVLSSLFPRLPAVVEGGVVPNYLEDFLAGFEPPKGRAPRIPESILELFLKLWRRALADGMPALEKPCKAVLEAACGSANDYRVLRACGFSRVLDYTGFDLCPANIENARGLFPDARFMVGNVFEVPAGDQSFDLCFTHDLFEHLSAEGIETAAAELCRITRWGLSVAFFNMENLPAHHFEPYEDYHWNILSAECMREVFARQGFEARMIHVGTFLREQAGCDATHNSNAWTFWLERRAKGPSR